MEYKILVADDEKEIRNLLKLYLENDGFKVVEASTGLEVLDLLDKEKPDMCLLDIMMPGADGYAVLRTLRSKGDMTPVLFLTARDSISDRVRGLDSGANDYLVKPFSFDELLARVRSMTRTRFDHPLGRHDPGAADHTDLRDLFLCQ